MNMTTTKINSVSPVSLVRAQEESVKQQIYITKIFNRLTNLSQCDYKKTVEVQGLLYQEKHADAFIQILKDALPVATDVSGVLKKIAESLDGSENDSTVTGVIKSLMGATESIRKTSSQVISTGESVLGITATGAILYSVYQFINSPNITNAILVLVTGVVIWMLDNTINPFSAFKELLSGCWNSVVKMFTSVFDSDEQKPDLNMEPVITTQSFATTAIYDSVIISWLGYLGISGANIDKKSVSQFSELLRMRNNIPEFLDSLRDYLIKLYKKFATKFMASNNLPFSTYDDPYLQAFEDDVMQVLEQRSSGKFSLSLTNCAKVRAMHEQAKVLYNSIPITKECTSTRQLFKENVNVLGKLRRQFDDANIHLNGIRTEPVGVLIRGGPNTHKSTIMSSIAASVAAATLSKEDYEDYKQCPQNFEFNRQQETVYMDGYSPKTITITFDDLGQARDVAGNPDNEWMNVIRFINSFEANGHAAAMEQKGVMRIRPKFVLATTNMIRLTAQSIHDINAVIRRFPISVTVVPKPEFKAAGSTGIYDQRFDYSKLEQVTSPDGTVTPNFQVTNCMFYNCMPDGTTVGEPFTYEVLMDKIIEQHKKRIAYHNKHVDNFAKLGEEMRKRYQPDDVQLQSMFNIFKRGEDLSSDDDEDNESQLKWDLNSSLDVDENLLNLKRKLIDEYNLPSIKAIKRNNVSHSKIFSRMDLSDEERKEVENFYYNYFKIIPMDLEFYEEFYENPEDIADLHYYDAFIHVWKFNKELLLASLIEGKRVSGVVDNLIPSSVWKAVSSSVTYHFHRTKDIMIKFYNSIKKFMSNIGNYLSQHENPMICLILGLVIGKVAKFFRKETKPIHIRNDLFVEVNNKEKEIVGNSPIECESTFYEVEKGKKQPAPKHRSIHSLQKMVRTGKIETQGDKAGVDVMQSILSKNTVRVFTFENDEDDEPKFNGYAILLKKNYVLVPQHFVEKMMRHSINDEDKLKFFVKLLPAIDQGPQTTVVGSCTVEEFIDASFLDMCDDNHMVIVKMPTRDCRDIIDSFFIDDHMASRMSTTFSVSLAVPHRNVRFNSTAYKTSVPIKDTDVSYNVPRGVRYYADTMTGDCGSPLFIRDARLQAHRIIGVHIAGSTGTGEMMAFASFITSNTIHSVIEAHEEEIKEDLTGVRPIELQSAPPFIADRFRVLGQVPQNHSPYGITEIRKSRLQVPTGPYVSKMAVATLRPFGDLDPYQLALKNYCSNQSILDPTLKRHSVEDFKSFLFSCPPGKPRILNLVEALWGNSDIEFSDAIKSSTSSGYPMKYDKVNIKKTLFSVHQPRTEQNPAYDKFNNHINDLITQIKNGERPLFVFTDNMKDQRVKLAKARDGVNRLFSGSPFDYLVLSRMYFGAFAQWIHSNSGRNGMVTAINPFSSQWDTMAHHIKSKDSNKDPWACDGDFKHFDASMITDFAVEILNIINEWYNDEYTKIRSILWLELINSRHMFNNIIFEWYGALPSGHPLTLIINCMNNHLIHRYCFFMRIPTTVRFAQVVLLYVTGDDALMAVTDEYKDSFNGVILAELMAEIGYVYTSADKDSAIVPFKRLSEVSFLKRGFRYEPLLSRYVGPLDINSILEIPLWTKKNDSLAITESNINEYLDELCLHDEETWNKYAPDFQRAVLTLFPEFSQNNRIMDSRVQRLSIKMDVPLNPFKVAKNRVRNPVVGDC